MFIINILDFNKEIFFNKFLIVEINLQHDEGTGICKCLFDKNGFVTSQGFNPEKFKNVKKVKKDLCDFFTKENMHPELNDFLNSFYYFLEEDFNIGFNKFEVLSKNDRFTLKIIQNKKNKFCLKQISTSFKENQIYINFINGCDFHRKIFFSGLLEYLPENTRLKTLLKY